MNKIQNHFPPHAARFVWRGPHGGGFLFDTMTDNAERASRTLCDHCGITCTGTQRVIKKKRLRRIKIASGRDVNCLCLSCYKLKSDERAMSVLDSVAVLRMRLQSGVENQHLGDLTTTWVGLEEGRDFIEMEIKATMKKISELVDASNLLSRMFSECSTKLGDILWASYPERRKRANYEISIKHLRAMVFSRDGYKCKQCGYGRDLTLDHVTPVLLGGSNEPDNLQTLCRRCNSRKGTTI
jgi:hypothetical protein